MKLLKKALKRGKNVRTVCLSASLKLSIVGFFLQFAKVLGTFRTISMRQVHMVTPNHSNLVLKHKWTWKLTPFHLPTLKNIVIYYVSCWTLSTTCSMYNLYQFSWMSDGGNASYLGVFEIFLSSAQFINYSFADFKEMT